MKRSFLKLLPILSFSVLILVIIKVPAPDSWKEANTFQILAFVAPLLATIVSVLKLFLRNLTISFLLGLSLLMLLVFKIIDIFNPFTILAVLIVCIGLILYLLKPKLNLKRFFKRPKPKQDLKPIKSLNKKLR